MAENPTFDDEKEEMLIDVHNEVFGTSRRPEQGLVKRFEMLTTRLEPVAKAFEGAKWPIRIAGAALTLVATGWLVDFIKMLPTALGLGK